MAIEALKKELISVNEGITHALINDMARGRDFAWLCKKKKILQSTIEKLERIERRRLCLSRK